jgi:dTDP-4-amino-4,6-dideoxygalactose transaminase
MARRRIELARGVYDKPLHVQPVFRKYVHGRFPLASDFSSRHVCLPIFRTMKDSEVERVIAGVRAFTAGERPLRFRTSADFSGPSTVARGV